MNSHFEPWAKYPPLTSDRLSTIAESIRSARHEAVLLHEPGAGDNEWSLGCRVYARTCHALVDAAKKFEWLTILREYEKPLRFTFAIGSIPIRFYRGEASDPPGNYLAVTYAELHQQQLAFEIDGIRLVDHILRLAVEIDLVGEVSGVILVEMDKSGTVTETYVIESGSAIANVTPLISMSVALPPLTLEALDSKGEEKRPKVKHANSQ